jgi:DNA-directed RNA polymerase subunit L
MVAGKSKWEYICTLGVEVLVYSDMTPCNLVERYQRFEVGMPLQKYPIKHPQTENLVVIIQTTQQNFNPMHTISVFRPEHL